MKKLIAGSYLKPAGADWVLWFDGKKWHSAECLGCEVARGNIISKQRLSTSDFPRLRHKLGYNYESRHDKELHKSYLKNLKRN